MKNVVFGIIFIIAVLFGAGFFGQYSTHSKKSVVSTTEIQTLNLLPAPKICQISKKSENFVQGNLAVEYWEVDGMPCVKINSLNPSFSCDWSKNIRQDLK